MRKLIAEKHVFSDPLPGATKTVGTYSDPTPTLLRPYSDPTPTYSDPTPTLLSRYLLRPYSDPTPTLLRPYSDPTPTLLGAHFSVGTYSDPTPTLLRPYSVGTYSDPTPTLLRPYSDPTPGGGRDLRAYSDAAPANDDTPRANRKASEQRRQTTARAVPIRMGTRRGFSTHTTVVLVRMAHYPYSAQPPPPPGGGGEPGLY